MRFSVVDIEGKASYLGHRLLEAGHTYAESLSETDVFILDCDWEWAGNRRDLIGQAVEAGAKVALYPHGGQSTVFVYDGLTDPDDRVSVRFEHGLGPVRVAETIGADLKQQVTGWLWSPTSPFKPVKEPRKVLFAPLHPNMEALQKMNLNGGDPAPALNQHVYKQLLRLGLDLTVSVVGPLWRNGVWAHPKATMVHNPSMGFPQSYGLIQDADVVVAAGSLAAAGVAAGKPTVFMGGHDCMDYVGGQYVRAENAGLYEELFRYPLNAEDAPLDDLIRAACSGSNRTRRWRKDWVGDDGTENAVRILEGLCPSPRNAIIQGVTARAGTRADM